MPNIPVQTCQESRQAVKIEGQTKEKIRGNVKVFFMLQNVRINYGYERIVKALRLLLEADYAMAVEEKEMLAAVRYKMWLDKVKEMEASATTVPAQDKQ